MKRGSVGGGASAASVSAARAASEYTGKVSSVRAEAAEGEEALEELVELAAELPADLHALEDDELRSVAEDLREQVLVLVGHTHGSITDQIVDACSQ